MIEYETIVDEAWDHLDLNQTEQAAALARAALTHRPDGIDAYVVLAATREVRAEAVALLKEAVRMGTEAKYSNQSQRGEQESPCDFDAYVRALNNLSRLLWIDPRPGSKEEALMHARRALKLDPYDRAGTRLLLMSWEASAGNWSAARRITRRYRAEDRTEVRYWLALHAFRERARNADTLLNKALTTNPYVSAALHGHVLPIYPTSGSYTFGSLEEAILYSIDAREAWKSTTGAMNWLSSREG